MRPTLIATVHDPKGRLLDATLRHSELISIYDSGYFRCTDTTDPHLIDALERIGNVSIGAPNSIGQSRREVLQRARADGAESIMYCDFDRWLHWVGSYRHELIDLPRKISRRLPRAWYVCLGRTPRAFATHPKVQCYTEDFTNQVISLLAGEELDATAGACWMTGSAADLILSESIEASNATDLEWPALIAVVDRRRLGCLKTEGLEFETATFHLQEIQDAGGTEAWLAKNYERPDVWKDRIKLMNRSIEVALDILDEK